MVMFWWLIEKPEHLFFITPLSGCFHNFHQYKENFEDNNFHKKKRYSKDIHFHRVKETTSTPISCNGMTYLESVISFIKTSSKETNFYKVKSWWECPFKFNRFWNHYVSWNSIFIESLVHRQESESLNKEIFMYMSICKLRLKTEKRKVECYS